MRERLEKIQQESITDAIEWGCQYGSRSQVKTEEIINDVQWLIEQAKKVCDLEDENTRLKLDAAKSIPLYSRRKLQTDKDRYERALKDIRDVSTGTVNQWAKKALEER